MRVPLLLLGLALLASVFAAPTNPADIATLMAIAAANPSFSSPGLNDYFPVPWPADVDPCTPLSGKGEGYTVWRGVICTYCKNCTYDYVIGLRINSILTGPIPPVLANLSALEELDLSSNGELSGPIPPELGKLSALQFLDLSGNTLSGSIPPELGLLTKLTTLNLGSNSLSGVVPAEVWNLSSANSANLAGADLTDNFLSSSVGSKVPSTWSLGLNCFNLSVNHVYEAGQQGADKCSEYYPALDCSCVPPSTTGILNSCLCVEPRRYIATFSCSDYISCEMFSVELERTRKQLAGVLLGKGVPGWTLEQLNTRSLTFRASDVALGGQIDLTFDLLPPAGAQAFTSYINDSISKVMGSVSNFMSVQVPGFDPGLTGLMEVHLQFSSDPSAAPLRGTRGAEGRLIVIAVSASVATLIIAAVIVVVISCWPRRTSSKRITIEGSPVAQLLLSDVKTATSNFDEGSCLGSGGFASVYKAVFENGDVMAVKRAKSGRVQLDEFVNEIMTVGQIHHRNLATLTGYCIDEDEYLLLYEFMANGSLQNRLFGEASRLSPLDWQQCVVIMLGAASGLAYLHAGCKPRIIHRDIKPANILLDDKLRASIADWFC